MTARLLGLLALAAVMAQAQMVLYSLSGTVPSPLGSVYGYGQVAAGDLKDVRFRALNTGTASVTITLLKVVNTAGAGFSIVNSSSTPFVVAPATQWISSCVFQPLPSPAIVLRSRSIRSAPSFWPQWCPRLL